jgi:hypothetical protein
MKMRIYLIVTTLLFALVGIVHLVRFALGWQAEVGTWSVPLWASLLAVAVFGGFAIWGATLTRRLGH